MEFTDYQHRSHTTDQNPQLSAGIDRSNPNVHKHEAIPLLGLVGEVGGLLSEYKKMLRDGAVHEQFPEQVAEELGDILWYVAAVATKFGLDLNKIAEDNLTKTEDRWIKPNGTRKLYDADAKSNQQLPRTFCYTFSHDKIDGEEKLFLHDCGTKESAGDPLTDNAYEDDGYRYHDIMHLAFMAHLGWSPVFRKLLRSKQKKIVHRDAPIDGAEDGGRAQVIEEGIVAAIYVYAEKHAFLDGVDAVDWHLLRHIKQMTDKLEVKDRKTWEWNKVILSGVKIWRKLKENRGGTVQGDLNLGTLSFTPPKST